MSGPLDINDYKQFFDMLKAVDDKKLDRAEYENRHRDLEGQVSKLDLRLTKAETELDTHYEKLLTKIELGDERNAALIMGLREDLAKRDANKLSALFSGLMTFCAGAGVAVVSLYLTHIIH